MTLATNLNGADIAPNLSVLNQLATQSNQVFFPYNLSTKHLDFINPTFKEVWNTRKKEVDEKWLLKSICPEDRHYVEDSLREFIAGKENKRIEFRIQVPQQVVKWVSLSAFFVLEGEKKNAIFGFAEDVTAQKEREDNSAKFTARTNAVLEILSHDVKGALAMIQAMNDYHGGNCKQDYRGTTTFTNGTGCLK